MKKINIYIASLLLSALAVSCSVDDLKPQGTLDEGTAFSSPEKLVTAAYAKLGDDWYSYPFNLWPYGDMSADDCLKGGSGENDTGALSPHSLPEKDANLRLALAVKAEAYTVSDSNATMTLDIEATYKSYETVSSITTASTVFTSHSIPRRKESPSANWRVSGS